MYVAKMAVKREHFPLIQEHFPFEVLQVCFVFSSSLLGIQVMASLVFSHSLTLWVLVQWCRVRWACVPASAAATAANCWVARRSGSRSSFPLYLWPWRPHDTPARTLCLQAPGRDLWWPVSGKEGGGVTDRRTHWSTHRLFISSHLYHRYRREAAHFTSYEATDQ